MLRLNNGIYNDLHFILNQSGLGKLLITVMIPCRPKWTVFHPIRISFFSDFP